MLAIDLNSDLGESFGRYTLGMDGEIIPLVSSANVACGYHASDPVVMKKTVELAGKAGVEVGAHPGFPDLMGFGRRNMSLTADEAYSYTMYQLGALDGFLKAAGMKMQHVKPHGAMYNMAAKDYKLAEAICCAVRDYDPGLIVLALAGGELLRAAEDLGLPAAAEYFADRAYEDDGTLRNRRLEGSMITDEDVAIERTIRMIREHKVRTYSGNDLTLKGSSVCVHGDGEKALAFVRKIRSKLAEEGIEILPLKKIL